MYLKFSIILCISVRATPSTVWENRGDALQIVTEPLESEDPSFVPNLTSCKLKGMYSFYIIERDNLYIVKNKNQKSVTKELAVSALNILLNSI